MTIQTLTILPAPYDDGKKVDFPRRIRPRRETNFNSSQWFRENANWKNFLSKQIPVELPLITNKVARPTVTKPSTWDPLIFSNLTSMQSLAARTQTEFARSKVNFLKQSFYPDQHRVRNENYSLSNLPDGSSTSEKRNDRDRNISNFLRSTFHKNKIEDQSSLFSIDRSIYFFLSIYRFETKENFNKRFLFEQNQFTAVASGNVVLGRKFAEFASTSIQCCLTDRFRTTS